jgi:hypothetical protein
MNPWTLPRLVMTILAAVALAGCPIPLLPGDRSETRRNIGDVVPDFIAIGSTTRADVLFALGQPDGASEHGEQFTYTRVTSKGGLGFFMAAGGGVGGGHLERMAYRRLVVVFDDLGIVRIARLEHATCTERSLALGEEVGGTPCLDVSGSDTISGVSASPVYGGAIWHQGVRGFDSIRAFRDPTPEVPGTLVVGESSVDFLPSNADKDTSPLLRIPYADIAEAYLDRFGFNRRVVIKSTSGAYETFSIKDGIFIAPDATEGVGKLIVQRWQAAIAPLR